MLDSISFGYFSQVVFFNKNLKHFSKLSLLIVKIYSSFSNFWKYLTKQFCYLSIITYSILVKNILLSKYSLYYEIKNLIFINFRNMFTLKNIQKVYFS